jgi:5,10-methylenetetrahydromethanopterin reductase
VTALGEALRCVRHLLRQSKEPLAGDIFPLAGGDSLRWSILRSEIPFLLGTWGAATIRACIGEISEIKIGGSANPAVIPHFQQILAQAATVTTPPTAVGICIGAVCVVDEDGAAARAHVKREVALYLPIVAELDPTVNLEPELVDRLKAAAAAYDYDGAARLISDEMLARFAFAGTPDEVAAHAADLFAAGATRVEFGTPHGLTPERGLQLLGSRVLPALRQR